MHVKTTTAVAFRQFITDARTVVVKIGTKVLVHEDGSVATEVLDSIAESVAQLRATGRQVLLVSSGAVGIGAGCLNVAPGLVSVCAAAGQSVLTALYHEAFKKREIAIAQILVTDDDFLREDRQAKLRNTLLLLVELCVVPVINENDVVTHSPDVDPNSRLISDNDMLAALVAKAVDADLLVVLTDVDGVYTSHPSDADALFISQMTGSVRVFDFGEQISERGRGGMQAKIRAASQAVSGNKRIAVIANGRLPKVLDRILAGQQIGTLIASREAQ